MENAEELLSAAAEVNLGSLAKRTVKRERTDTAVPTLLPAP